jgi:hypothetical protein
MKIKTASKYLKTIFHPIKSLATTVETTMTTMTEQSTMTAPDHGEIENYPNGYSKVSSITDNNMERIFNSEVIDIVYVTGMVKMNLYSVPTNLFEKIKMSVILHDR